MSIMTHAGLRALPVTAAVRTVFSPSTTGGTQLALTAVTRPPAVMTVTAYIKLLELKVGKLHWENDGLQVPLRTNAANILFQSFSFPKYERLSGNGALFLAENTAASYAPLFRARAMGHLVPYSPV